MIYSAGKESSRNRKAAPVYFRRLAALLIVLALLTGNIPLAAAAGDWDSALEEFHDLYEDYTGLQVTLKAEISRNQTLRKQNTSDLSAINSQLKSINQSLLNRLKSEAEATQKKHAPLLEQYTTLGKQASAARKANNQKSAASLNLKRNKLKASATAARAEIKVKTTALAEARKSTAAKIKPTKDALAPVSALRKQITAENKKVSELQAIRSEADKRYKAAVKAGDAVAAAAGMKLSYAKMSEIRVMVQQMYSWEQKISAALRTAESKIPK
ncbi:MULTISPECIES: hypothetical protein [Paenibacillus]|uniref:Colicin import membrane protein n=1 Tax=Paenibacillus borealis TaxID=160799 RepID=A0ABX3H2S9_PAEBO|nr:hypothetical protein [Paenibacillus borealis]OMD43828.1 hypothetical protein BSK56_23765 [Paenibacillus borealis]